MAQNAILLFLSVKFNFCRKKSAAKLLFVKTSRGRFVATPFLYLMIVHRKIAGDVPIYLKFALEVGLPTFDFSISAHRRTIEGPKTLNEAREA